MVRLRSKPGIEAPVNGGRNYNGPKVAKFCRVSSDPHERCNDFAHCLNEGPGEIEVPVKMQVTRDWTERPSWSFTAT